jgi:hypothetical protein
MTNFCNLKIAINDQQPLDEVVKELERLGYFLEHKSSDDVSCIVTFDDGAYHLYEGNPVVIFKDDSFMIETTLAELKEM